MESEATPVEIIQVGTGGNKSQLIKTATVEIIQLGSKDTSSSTATPVEIIQFEDSSSSSFPRSSHVEIIQLASTPSVNSSLYSAESGSPTIELVEVGSVVFPRPQNLVKESKNIADLIQQNKSHESKIKTPKLRSIAPSPNFKPPSTCDPALTRTRVKNYVCIECGYATQKSGNYNRHLTSHSKIQQKCAIPCPESECTWTATTMSQLDFHLTSTHNRKMEVQNILFENDSAFKHWLGALKNVEKQRFTKRKPKNCNIIKYFCNRSGIYKPQGKGIRYVKKISSIKIGKICTARIIVRPSKMGMNVTYHKTHLGHGSNEDEVATATEGLEHLNSPSRGRVKTTEETICRSYSGDVSSLDLITAKDVMAAAERMGIPPDSLQKLKKDLEYAVLFYKPRGVISADLLDLQENDFVMGYMNYGQAVTFRQFGKNMICLDLIGDMIADNVELTCVLTLNDQQECLPVAFMFHDCRGATKGTAYRLFFQKLKVSVGKINTKMIMCDDRPDVFNAWVEVMGVPESKQLCLWAVFRSWMLDIDLVEENVKRTVWEKLCSMVFELDIISFETALVQFSFVSTANEILQRFHDRFRTYYSANKAMWAQCYKVRTGINIKMHVERKHAEIMNRCLRNGKGRLHVEEVQTRMERYLLDMECERIVYPMAETAYVLTEQHALSCQLPISSVQSYEDHWFVSSSSQGGDPYLDYKIKRNSEPCYCSMICPTCGICVHAFECSCVVVSDQDRSFPYVDVKMCKHIHLLCRYLKETNRNPAAELFSNTINNNRHNVSVFGSPSTRDRFEVQIKRSQEFFAETCSLVTNTQSAKLLEEGTKALLETLKYHQNNDNLGDPVAVDIQVQESVDDNDIMGSDCDGSKRKKKRKSTDHVSNDETLTVVMNTYYQQPPIQSDLCLEIQIPAPGSDITDDL